MFSVSSLFEGFVKTPDCRVRASDFQSLPKAVDYAIDLSRVIPEDVLVTAVDKPYRLLAVYRDGALVSFDASVPT